MESHRYAISWRVHGKEEEVHDLTAEETGMKLTELLKENVDPDNLDKYDGAGYIRIRYWRTIYG